MACLDDEYRDLWPYRFWVLREAFPDFVKRIIMKANRSGLNGQKVVDVTITSEMGNYYLIEIEIDRSGEKECLKKMRIGRV